MIGSRHMKKSEFQLSWEAFTEALTAKNIGNLTNLEPPDLEHLNAMKAHEDLITAARHSHIAEAFNLAPSERARELSPDWIFKNSIAMGQDGCGNYILWMNVSRIDSPILFVCHDPAKVMVIAKSPADFFIDIRAFLSSYDDKTGSGLLYDYMRN